MTLQSTAVLTAAATYRAEYARLPALRAALDAAHDEAFDARGLPTDVPGAYDRHMQALDAHDAQARRVEQAGAALCAAARG